MRHEKWEIDPLEDPECENSKKNVFHIFVHIQDFQEIMMHQKRISDQEVIWKVSGQQQNMSR